MYSSSCCAALPGPEACPPPSESLTLTDTLHEGFAKLLFSNPLAALASLGAILQGRAAFQGIEMLFDLRQQALAIVQAQRGKVGSVDGRLSVAAEAGSA